MLSIVESVACRESIVMFIVFMVFVQLVLLNMLIAIMGNSVEVVKAEEVAAGFQAKCELIVDCWEAMSPTELLTNAKLFPRSFPLPVDPPKRKERKQRSKPVENKVTKAITHGSLGSTLNTVKSKVDENHDEISRVSSA